MQKEKKYYLCHVEYIDRDGAQDEYIVTNDEDAMLRDYKRAYPERIITACATAELARVISAVQNKDTPDNAYRDAIVRLIDRQRAKGMEKYGQTLEENTTLTTEQRIEHAQEELVDALQYLEHLKQTQADKLTANDYQRAAMRTASGMDRESYNGRGLLLNAVMGLNGEAGEVIDHVKKVCFQGHEIDRQHLIEELGDVAWYLAVCCEAIDTTLEEVLQNNIDKLKARYPDGFDKSRSINREETEK